MATIDDRISELKAVLDDAERRILALERDAGRVVEFVKSGVDIGPLTYEQLADILLKWDEFKAARS